MGQGKIFGSGGSGKIVNGIIEEYYAATEELKANTFVEFVNSLNITGYEGNTSVRNQGSVIAVKLSEQKICLCSAGSDYLVLQVVQINGNTISVGTALEVYCSAYTIRVDAASSSRIFVAVNYSTYYGRMYVFDISNLSISQTAYVERSGDVGWIDDMCCLDSSKAIVTYSYASQLHIELWSLTGTSLSKTLTKVITNPTGDASSSVLKLTPSKVLLLYYTRSDPYSKGAYAFYLRAVLITVSSSALTLGQIYETNYNVGNLSCVYKVNDTTVLIVSSLQPLLTSSPAPLLYGCVVKVDMESNDILVGSAKYLGCGALQQRNIKSFLADNNNNLLICMNRSQEGVGGFLPVKVIGTDIIVGEETILSDARTACYTCVAIQGNFVGVTSAAKCIVIHYTDSGIKLKKALETIHGLLISKATTTKKGKTQILNR